MTSALRFDGKGFLIAGACSEALCALGRAVVEQGAHVALCGAHPAEAAPPAPRLTAIAGDVTQETEVERIVDGALEALPGLDAVVVLLPAVADAPLAEMDLPEWNQSVLDPLRGCFLISRRAVEEFLAARTPGRIVFVSGWHPDTRPPAPRSEVVEGGLFALARSIAKEYGRRGIACNVVALEGPTVWQQEPSDPGPASPLIDAIQFLASEEASYLNGEKLVITGQ